MTRPLIVKHCALPSTLALSLPGMLASPCGGKYRLQTGPVAPHGPESLEAELSILGPFVVSEATISEGSVPV